MTILRIVHNLKIDGIICILSFDNQQMKKIFERMQIDYSYLEKMIQTEVVIPPVNYAYIKNVVHCSVANYFRVIDIGNVQNAASNIQSDKLFHELTQHIGNLRSFKHVINTAVTGSMFRQNATYDKTDAFLAGLISLTNPALYEEIRDNWYYFADQGWPNSLYSVQLQYPDQQIKYFREGLIENKSLKAREYSSLLGSLFPCFRGYYISDLSDSKTANLPNGMPIPVFRERYDSPANLYDDLFSPKAKNINFVNEYFPNNMAFDLRANYDFSKSILEDFHKKKINIVRLVEKCLNFCNKVEKFQIDVFIDNFGRQIGEVPSENFHKVWDFLFKLMPKTDSQSIGRLALAILLTLPQQYYEDAIKNLVSSENLKIFYKSMRASIRQVKSANILDGELSKRFSEIENILQGNGKAQDDEVW